jgi:hypothetical protein
MPAGCVAAAWRKAREMANRKAFSKTLQILAKRSIDRFRDEKAKGCKRLKNVTSAIRPARLSTGCAKAACRKSGGALADAQEYSSRQGKAVSLSFPALVSCLSTLDYSDTVHLLP